MAFFCNCCPVHEANRPYIGASVWFWPPADWESEAGNGPLAAIVTGLVDEGGVRLAVFSNSVTGPVLRVEARGQCIPHEETPGYWSFRDDSAGSV